MSIITKASIRNPEKIIFHLGVYSSSASSKAIDNMLESSVNIVKRLFDNKYFVLNKPWYYSFINFHINQYILFILHLQQDEIHVFLYQRSLVISHSEFHSFNNSKSREYWNTFLEDLQSFQDFHFEGETLHRNL